MTRNLARNVAVILLVGLATGLVTWSIRSRGGDPDGSVYFYDLSEQKLFVAPRSSVPPIRGINNAELDGVRAVVISTTGNPRDKKNRKIAYLEKYSPELKAQFEVVQREGAAAQVPLTRESVPANTFVRRLNESQWHTMNTPEGEKIVSEWNIPGPDGNYPVICVP